MTALEQSREALQAAQGCIQMDRTALADAHMCPVTNEVDAEGRDGVADYDAVLKLIADAIAALSAQEVPAGEWVMVPREPTEAMLDAAHEADREYTLRTFGDIMTVQQGPYDHWRAMLTAAPAAPKQEWQPIETAPKDGRKLILAYTNLNGKARTVMGRWVTDEEAAETDADDVGLEAGWYECIDNWPDYTQVAIHKGEPSHWMPLPSAPAAPRG